MVRNIVCIMVNLFIFSSCIYSGEMSGYGKPRTKIKHVRIEKKIFNQIDTLAIYKLNNYYSYIDRHGKYIIAQENNKQGNDFYRFYKDGKLSIFTGIQSLKREDLDPKKGLMGVYYIKGNDIMIKYYIIVNGEGRFQKKYIQIKKDSMIVKSKNSAGGEILVKEDIDRSLLNNWKPDW